MLRRGPDWESGTLGGMMIQTVFEQPGLGRWIDIENPTQKELQQIASQYGLLPNLVEDCLEPEHLPKFEKIPGAIFLILRAYDGLCLLESDTVQELTRKVAIFFADDFLITIHRKEEAFLTKIKETYANLKAPSETSLPQILIDLITSAVLTYETPIDFLQTQFESFETQIFDPEIEVAVKDGYFLKRKASVFRRILRLTSEVVSKLSAVTTISPTNLQDLRESVEHCLFFTDEIQENTTSLLNLHVSLSSQKSNEASFRTNEVMKILTIFSVFFLPLNFIAGVYGMNFKYMPELDNPYGYFGALAFMAIVTSLIAIWFHKRNWI